MADQICANILESYRRYVDSSIAIEAEGDHCRLFAPLYLPDNTQLSLCVEQQDDGNILVTDYGDTEAFLFLSGLELDANDIRRVRITRRFGVSSDGGALEKRVVVSPNPTGDEIGSAINDVIHAMLDTAYLTVDRNARQMRAFSAEVQRFFEDHGTNYVRRPKVEGKSGQQAFEFSIHQSGGVYLADGISAVRRDAAKKDAQLLVFKAEDVAAVAKGSYRFICLLDDRTDETRTAIDDSVIAPLEAWNIEYVRWSDHARVEALAA